MKMFNRKTLILTLLVLLVPLQVFADEYLIKILDILNLPNWVEGIGYSYLSNDEKFVLYLKERGIIIERY